MIKVKFLVDYQGELTQDKLHLDGGEAVLDDEIAKKLAKSGSVEILEVLPAPKSKAKPKKK